MLDDELDDEEPEPFDELEPFDEPDELADPLDSLVLEELEELVDSVAAESFFVSSESFFDDEPFFESRLSLR